MTAAAMAPPAASGWTWVDAVWVVILAALLLRGFLRGLVHEIMELVALGLSLYAAARLYQPLGEWLLRRLPMLPEPASRALAFGLILAAALTAGAVLTGMVAHVARVSPLSWWDSLGGAAIGAAKGLAVVAALVVVLTGLPDGSLRDELSRSVITRELQRTVPQVWGEVRQAFPEVLPPLPAMEPGLPHLGSPHV